ncbi:hypothetical protein [Cohnella rhizosphaerae]|uniref:Uncharacterized protein n=1 Tax=Cohnella rhizosphaerae TaxID=1457232 RepID=A0A9X4QTB9_9BACL|nr:hypothetical protein [Cohnella rhizosphaerae]MDG0810535.1 hypothetical protein [Cohnella rhizosphaerae]
MSYKAILFDLYNTLLNDSMSELKSMHYNRAGRPIDADVRTKYVVHSLMNVASLLGN